MLFLPLFDDEEVLGFVVVTLSNSAEINGDAFYALGSADFISSIKKSSLGMFSLLPAPPPVFCCGIGGDDISSGLPVSSL